MELGAALSGDLRTDHTEARAGEGAVSGEWFPLVGSSLVASEKWQRSQGLLDQALGFLFHVQWDTLVGFKQRRLWIVLSALVMRFEWRGLEAEAVCFGMIEGEVERKS